MLTSNLMLLKLLLLQMRKASVPLSLSLFLLLPCSELLIGKLWASASFGELPLRHHHSNLSAAVVPYSNVQQNCTGKWNTIDNVLLVHSAHSVCVRPILSHTYSLILLSS